MYLLHAEDEVLSSFKIYQSKVEIQVGCKLKRLRTNKKGEYYDPSYFHFMGIIHETIVWYAPQLNGVAERKNRTLQEMVNSVLSYSSLSKGFCVEAMLTAYHILNWVPFRTNKEIPYELWYKRKPNLNYLKVRGCGAIVKVPGNKRKKLGEWGLECICIGYAQNNKTYRFNVI